MLLPSELCNLLERALESPRLGPAKLRASALRACCSCAARLRCPREGIRRVAAPAPRSDARDLHADSGEDLFHAATPPMPWPRRLARSGPSNGPKKPAAFRSTSPHGPRVDRRDMAASRPYPCCVCLHLHLPSCPRRLQTRTRAVPWRPPPPSSTLAGTIWNVARRGWRGPSSCYSTYRWRVQMLCPATGGQACQCGGAENRREGDSQALRAHRL